MLLILIFYSSSPPDGYAGDPPNNAYCTACHTGAPLNPGNGSVYIPNLPAFFSPNNSYDLNIVVKGVGTKRFGFEMIIKDLNNNVIGTIQAIGPNTTVSAAGYAKHQNAPLSTDSFVFQIRWNTPANPPSQVRIYLVGNVANGNGQSTGDSIYSKVYTLDASSIAEIKDVLVYKRGNKLIVEANMKIPIMIEFYREDGSKQVLLNTSLQGKKVLQIKGRGIVRVKGYNFSKVLKF